MWNPLKRITFRQTGYYAAWLLRRYYAKAEGWNGTPLFFRSQQTVEKHKCCWWFKAQANRRGDRALCLLSALQLEGHAVQKKGSVKKLPIHCAVYKETILKKNAHPLLCIDLAPLSKMSKTYFRLKLCNCIQYHLRVCFKVYLNCIGWTKFQV